MGSEVSGTCIASGGIESSMASDVLGMCLAADTSLANTACMSCFDPLTNRIPATIGVCDLPCTENKVRACQQWSVGSCCCPGMAHELVSCNVACEVGNNQ